MTRPSGLAIEPGVLVPSTVVAAVASALSLHVFARFGVVPGAELLAVAVSAGVGLLPRFKWARGSDRRLLLQTAATAATISTALTFMLPLGIAFSLKVANQAGLILLGTGLAAGVALLSLRWLCDSALMPAGADAGIARAARWVGCERGSGGWPALGLLVGVGAGGWGGGLASALPSAFGLAFLGNGFGLGVLGVGMVLRPTLPYILRADLQGLYVPHGLMIGAGAVALVQALLLAIGNWFRGRAGKRMAGGGDGAQSASGSLIGAVRSGEAGREPPGRGLLFGIGTILLSNLLVGLLMLASIAGGPLAELLATAMLAAGIAVVYQLLLGFTASQAGSIPAFGGGLAVLAVAYCVGVAPTGALVALALALAAGPLFAETGLALKGAAEIGFPALRGQQIVAALVGLGVALAVVAAISGGYLERGFVPPTAVVLATIVELEERFGGLSSLAPWIGAGALVQLLGGRRQVGLLLATGLLIEGEAVGWTLLAGVAARALSAALLRGRADDPLASFGLGCIAGDMVRSALRIG